VTERLDEIGADCQRAWGAEDEARFWLPGDRLVYVEPRWALEAWLPSLRRRAERHRHDSGLWPCPDYRDLCAEIGIDPEESA
jgi:hypothetical protein